MSEAPGRALHIPSKPELQKDIANTFKMWSALQKRFASSAGSSGSSPADGNAPIPDNGDGTTFSPNVNHGEPESKEPSQVVNQEDGAEVPNATAQDGVTQAEAITLSWSKASLGAAYIL